ncbi:transposase [Pseudomaricurvus alcaniphilus]|uniref:transposase n=1 Tax=Pseudomaricurvus alcaniphilus TaxID=1166482 RepID=UPI00140D8CC5|nr:transposase [Pseudomaricurvus alcaniphilus]NHN38746.1 transposase [Pseudomaricurvus alcaniphilus]
MARLPRLSPVGIPQHIIQRGNNRQPCFASEQDLAVYASWLSDYAAQYQVLLHAWVFMTNHVHILATPNEPGAISAMMQALGRRYVRYFNREHHRSGTLWEGRFKSNLVQSDTYVLVCQRYIELNPVRAGMVDDPADYIWSSYQAHALGKTMKMHSPHQEYLALGRLDAERAQVYRELFRSHIDVNLTAEITSALNKGMALGSDRFKDELEKLYERRVRPAKMGRPMVNKLKVSSDPTL